MFSSLVLYFPWPLFRQWQPFDSVIFLIFLHNMFRPSGPDHVLARTAKIQGKPNRKWMWGLSQIKTNYMAEKVKVKALNIRKLQHCFKKVLKRFGNKEISLKNVIGLSWWISGMPPSRCPRAFYRFTFGNKMWETASYNKLHPIGAQGLSSAPPLDKM